MSTLEEKEVRWRCWPDTYADPLTVPMVEAICQLVTLYNALEERIAQLEIAFAQLSGTGD